ncbi:uncharacterized protein YggE [Bacillus pakistanensis]|uniref:Uncharacterized protein YggE n=1 Tax=Rossellomorea pakistanensis TaxID=992288 RepID=A0ABS2NET3_9BACI|nr:SIMPL domain-containing protein [Bacillus pakistanensis]MBM7586328.1 uncharacterized protein YggE [Bacillus pakistanensis]
MYRSMYGIRDNTKTSRGTITVSGEHTLFVDPNQATATLGVVTNDKELSIAQQQNNLISSRLLLCFKSSGISENDIQTITYQVYPQYRYEDGQQILTGYEVRQIFQITIRDINKVGKIIDEALKCGANVVESIQFVHSDPGFYYQNALTAAYKTAFQKAKTLSHASGQNLNPQPKVINEQPINVPIPYANVQLLKAADQGAPVQPGQIAIRAVVSVEFYTY